VVDGLGDARQGEDGGPRLLGRHSAAMKDQSPPSGSRALHSR
jgi:hypothetical protein